MKTLLFIFSITFITVLTSCGGSNSTGSSNSNTITQTNTSSSSNSSYRYLGTIQSNLSITSSNTGITYPYHVYLPHNYEISNKRYPVIYGTDAQWIFRYFSERIDFKNKDVIFVGIAEGPPNSDRRIIDFAPNGAPRYISFLKDEFIPFIENNYRTNSERTYIGTSYGGLLGSILLTQEPIDKPYFKNYMLYDGSFWALQAANIQEEEERFNASKKLAVTLILTSANPVNLVDVDNYQSRYENRSYEELTIYRRSYQVTHNDVANPSFDETIDLIY